MSECPILLSPGRPAPSSRSMIFTSRSEERRIVTLICGWIVARIFSHLARHCFTVNVCLITNILVYDFGYQFQIMFVLYGIGYYVIMYMLEEKAIDANYSGGILPTLKGNHKDK